MVLAASSRLPCHNPPSTIITKKFMLAKTSDFGEKIASRHNLVRCRAMETHDSTPSGKKA